MGLGVGYIVAVWSNSNNSPIQMSEAEELAWASEELEQILQSVRSCMLATVSKSGVPLQSYAPVFVDERRQFFVYVSAMAKHYAHLRKSGLASLSLIEDESTAENLFARKRVTVDCRAKSVERDTDEWKVGVENLEQRHGETMAFLKDLVDFDLFCLTPSEGRLVLGFGKAYRVSGEALQEVSYIGAGGHRGKS